MPVTKELQLELERNRSHYGCGDDTCARCYPLQYACDNCNARFPSPILNGEFYQCDVCTWEHNVDTH
jgi:hypothetical protein